MPLAFRWLGVVTFFFVAAPRGHSEIAPIPGDGYIRSWLVLGPYMASGPAPGKDYLRRSWITDGTLTEETVCPQAGTQVHTDYSKAAPVGLYETRPELGLNPNGKEGPTWFRYDTRPWADDWHVRIDSEVFGQPYNLDNSATLGCVYLVNSGDDAVDVLIGAHSDDSLQVTLNNDELFAYSVAREVGSYGRPQHLARAKIYPGYNRVLFKVTTGVYAFGFALRVTGLDHAPPPPTRGSESPSSKRRTGSPRRRSAWNAGLGLSMRSSAHPHPTARGGRSSRSRGISETAPCKIRRIRANRSR
ncbi:MAG: hypothetical protein ACUVYA_02580 [Planctomycetota bacterium]